MPECPYLTGCRLTRDEAGFSPEFVRSLEDGYCTAGYTACARYLAAQQFGPENVPDDLFPVELERVDSSTTVN